MSRVLRPITTLHLGRRGLVAAVLVTCALVSPFTTAFAAPLTAGVVADTVEDEAPGQQEGAGRTTWSITPALGEDHDQADARVSLRLETEPGGRVSDAVTVTNYGDRPATFTIYASDGVITADGQFDVLPSATEATAAGSWVSIGDGEPGEHVSVELEAESDATIPLEIAVPDNATPGDHPAGVVAALAQESGGVAMESRVGVRIHLRVAGELEPALAVRDVEATYESSWNPLSTGTLRLVYRLENVGNVRLGAQSTVTGTGPFGLGKRATPGDEHREILPGQTVETVVVLEDVWPLLRIGGDVAVIPVVVGDDVVEVPLPSADVSWSAWMIPWPQLITLGLLALAVFYGARRKARRES